MKRAALVLAMLITSPALAEDWDTVTVLDTPTKVTAGLTGTGYKTILVENGASAAVYCSRNPEVTVDDGHKVGATDGFRSFPHEGPVYCIAASSQSGTGRSHVIVWGSYR